MVIDEVLAANSRKARTSSGAARHLPLIGDLPLIGEGSELSRSFRKRKQIAFDRGSMIVSMEA